MEIVHAPLRVLLLIVFCSEWNVITNKEELCVTICGVMS